MHKHMTLTMQFLDVKNQENINMYTSVYFFCSWIKLSMLTGGFGEEGLNFLFPTNSFN